MATTRVILSYPWGGKINGSSNNNNNNNSNSKVDNENGVSEKVQKIAKKELRENESAREQSLEQFRDWIKKNHDISNVRTDDSFLLRFLRAKKFSVPMAEQMLLKYLNLRHTFPSMIKKLDFLEPKVASLINNGYIFASPIRDSKGRRVIIAFAKNFNPHYHCSADMARAHFITYETLLEDAENQILGFLHIGDMSGLTSAHITCWNVSDFARILKWGEQSIPMRHKEIHCVNVPTPVKYVLDFAKTRVSKKINDRLNIHINVPDMLKKVERQCLPLELGGTMPMAEMIDEWKSELVAKRDWIMRLDEMAILSDRGIITNRERSSNPASEINSIAGSFRKLEVD